MTPLVSMFTGNPGSKSLGPVALVPSFLKAEPKRVCAQNIALGLFSAGMECVLQRTLTPWPSC